SGLRGSTSAEVARWRTRAPRGRLPGVRRHGPRSGRHRRDASRDWCRDGEAERRIDVHEIDPDQRPSRRLHPTARGAIEAIWAQHPEAAERRWRGALRVHDAAHAGEAGVAVRAHESADAAVVRITREIDAGADAVDEPSGATARAAGAAGARRRAAGA